MSYQVLARKWRPQTFAEVVGQEHIARTLKNAVIQNRIGHAYLFVGSRGIGKTTSARIFAKALNCRQPLEGEPCCQCDNCLEIAQGNSMDVIEIDGASHNKVEDIRDIRDSVHYSPNKSKFKVYIIDEVHMLTTAAWNALLKTLEEPPAHVKFLFATTEPHKVLPTIISRCQRFDLRRIPVPLIVERLRLIAEKENIHIEEQALAAIARAADGGMRDAQSIFDQMIAFCGGLQEGELISEQDVIDVFGIASGSELRELGLAALGNDLNRAMLVLQKLSDAGRDLERVFEDLIQYVRNIMVCALSPAAKRFLELSSSELADLEKLAAAADVQLLQRILQGLIAQEWSFRSALNKRVYLEVLLCRVISEAHSVQIDEIMTRLNVMSGLLPAEQAPPPRAQIQLPPISPEFLTAPDSQEKTEPAKPAVAPEAAEQPAAAATAPPQPEGEPQAEAETAPPMETKLEQPPVPAPASAPAPAPQPEAVNLLSLDDAQADTAALLSLDDESEEACDADEEPELDTFQESAALLQDLTYTPEQRQEQLCQALEQAGPAQSKLAGLLAELQPSWQNEHDLRLAYDQRKVSEQDVRVLLEPKNLALMKAAYQGLTALGQVIIDRWTPDEEGEAKNGLRQASFEELGKLAEDPFVKAFNEELGTVVIDARLPQ
ncbi:MAG: DNA polymerase III subunit gamma/tau [Lentisphaerae bacterium]|nr:DNA polymerase III subunit gamma/tau [Lentisphaerota bacterium]